MESLKTSRRSKWVRAASNVVQARSRVQVLRVLWVYVVFYGERGSFHDAVGRCAWPDGPSSSAVSVTAVHVLLVSDPQIIDKQTYPDLPALLYPFVRHFSDNYLQNVWRSLVLNPNKWMSRGDGDAKGKGRQLTRPPDAVIWMGDLTDGGRRRRSDADWASLVQRFRSLFPRPRSAFWEEPPATLGSSRQVITRRLSSADHIINIYMPGNHDVGLPGVGAAGQRTDILASDDAVDRHKQAFGMKVDGGGYVVKSHQPSVNISLNGRILVSSHESIGATHELVLVNALDLVGMQRQGGGPYDTSLKAQHAGELDGALGNEAKAQFKETYNFVKHVGTSQSLLPRVLLTHVPLFRPLNASCDDKVRSKEHHVSRESPQLLRQDSDRGSTYQNLVGKEITEWVLSTLDPVAIFSGDDHDHCEYRHQRLATHSVLPQVKGFDATQIPELTVKSTSMTEGVRRPGFARLSLYPPSNLSSLSVSYTPCILPDQIAIWTLLYLPFLAITLLALMIRSSNIRPRQQTGYLPIATNKRDDDGNQDSDTRRASVYVNTTGWLQDLLAVIVFALPFWLACQTHFLF